MGIVSMGVPQDIVKNIAATYQIDTFVETGTYRATTTVWASKVFSHVYTIEASQEIFKTAVEKYGDIKNITFLFGHSKERLKEIVDTWESPRALFWLDAHWSGGLTYGEGDECPLMEELQTIIDDNNQHFILIDDARLFLAPPPKPHIITEWPDISDITTFLIKHGYTTVVYDDVIFAIPAENKDEMSHYFQTIVTEAWASQKTEPSFFQSLKTAIKSFLKRN